MIPLRAVLAAVVRLALEAGLDRAEIAHALHAAAAELRA